MGGALGLGGRGWSLHVSTRIGMFTDRSLAADLPPLTDAVLCNPLRRLRLRLRLLHRLLRPLLQLLTGL